MDYCLYDPDTFPNSPWLEIIVDLPLPAGKITIDVSDCKTFETLCSLLDRLFLGGLKF